MIAPRLRAPRCTSGFTPRAQRVIEAIAELAAHLLKCTEGQSIFEPMKSLIQDQFRSHDQVRQPCRNDRDVGYHDQEDEQNGKERQRCAHH